VNAAGKKKAEAQAVVMPLSPAAIAEKLRDELRRMAANTPYWEALEAARAAPIGALLDELALHDLVGLEMWMPQHLNNEHARQTWECISSVRSATDSMRANHWLRRAMVHSKDFMLWDDSELGGQVRADRAKGGKGKASKLPPAEVLHAELNHLVVVRELTAKQAKSVLRQKYGVTSQGLNGKLKKVKVA
jgi:hypothetical protein